MYKNKLLFFSLIVVIFTGSLLFNTSCSKYIGKYTMGGSGDHRFNQQLIDENVDLDDTLRSKIENGEIKELELNSINWSKIDLSKIDLCKVNNDKTLLCKALKIGALDLLAQCLKEIKNNPIKYPYEKVIALITGYRKPIRGIKVPLLIRAVNQGYDDNNLNTLNNPNRRSILLDILELLFGTLRHYSLSACEQAFSLQFGPGKYTIIHQAVDLSNLQMVKYLINKYIEIKTEQGMAYTSALTSLEEVLSIGNSINQTPLDLALTVFYLRCRNILTLDLGSWDSCSLELLDIFWCLVQYGNPSSQIKRGPKSVLHSIVKSGDATMFKMIITAYIDKSIYNGNYNKAIEDILNLSDEHGYTLLHSAALSEAARHSTPHIVEYLMSLGANATHFDKSGVSPHFYRYWIRGSKHGSIAIR